MSQTENVSSMKYRGWCFRKTGHPRNSQDGQGWEETEICDTLNIFDFGETRTPILIVEQRDEI